MFILREDYRTWHNHRSIRPVNITIRRPLTTTPRRIATIRQPITTMSDSTKRLRSTQPRLMNIANSPTNIRQLPTVILKSDVGTRDI